MKKNYLIVLLFLPMLIKPVFSKETVSSSINFNIIIPKFMGIKNYDENYLLINSNINYCFNYHENNINNDIKSIENIYIKKEQNYYNICAKKLKINKNIKNITYYFI